MSSRLQGPPRAVDTGPCAKRQSQPIDFVLGSDFSACADSLVLGQLHGILWRHGTGEHGLHRIKEFVRDRWRRGMIDMHKGERSGGTHRLVEPLLHLSQTR